MEQPIVESNMDSFGIFKQRVLDAEVTYGTLPNNEKKQASEFFHVVGERLKQAVAVVLNETYGETGVTSSTVSSTAALPATDEAAPSKAGEAGTVESTATSDAAPVSSEVAMDTVAPETPQVPTQTPADLDPVPAPPETSTAMETSTSEAEPVAMDTTSSQEVATTVTDPVQVSEAESVTMETKAQDTSETNQPASSLDTDVAQPTSATSASDSTQENVPEATDVKTASPHTEEIAVAQSEIETTQESNAPTQPLPDDSESGEVHMETRKETSTEVDAPKQLPDDSGTEEGPALARVEELKETLSKQQHEIQCLKECLWKISHPTTATTSATTNITEDPVEEDSKKLVSGIVDELVDKVVFLSETHDSMESLQTLVDVDLAIQNYPALKRPPVKRRRGRPPKHGHRSTTTSPTKPKRFRPEIEVDESIVKVEPKAPWEDGTDATAEEFDEDGLPVRTTRLRRRSRLQSKEAVDPLKEEVEKRLFNRIIDDDDEGDSGAGAEVPALSDLEDVDFEPGLADQDEEEEARQRQRPRRRRKPGRPRKAVGYITAPRGPHKRMIRHTCHVCSKTFYHGRPFNRHLLSHGKSRCSCRKCQREFLNYAVFLDHACLRPKLRNKDRPCPVCSTLFTNVKTLQRHMREEHNVKGFETLPFNCKYCNKAFPKRSSMFEHYSEHSEGKLVCLKCGLFFEDQTSLDSHNEADHMQEEGEYSCDACGACFNRRQQYGLHVQGQRKNQCIICDQPFCTKKLLDYHNRQAHGIKTLDPVVLKYTCEQCGKMFQRPGQLDIHMRIHTGEKPIECSVCKIHFRTTKALRKHQMTRTHMTRSGETKKGRDFLCSLCGKTYLRKQDLQRHLRYHTGAKPFQCPHCDFTCSERSNLKIHIGRHFSQRDHVCDKCGAAFHAKTTLEEHIIYKHTDIRNFRCEDCPRAFKTAKALKKHSKVHADLKEHKCAYCSVGFNRLYNLRHHMRAVHGNDDPLPVARKVGLVDVPEQMKFMKGSTAVAARERGLLLASGELNPAMVEKPHREEKTQRRRKKSTNTGMLLMQAPMDISPAPEHYNPPATAAPGVLAQQVVPITEDPTLQTDGSRLYRCLLTPASLAQSQVQPQVPQAMQAQNLMIPHSQAMETQSIPTPINYVLPYNVQNQ